jgi:hypothetical protein
MHWFLGDIVHDLGRLLFQGVWTGDEPATVIIYPVRPVLDTATTPADVAIATQILYAHHQGFRNRADTAGANGRPTPLPTADEWPIAHALSRQIADQTMAAFKRYRDVESTLVTLFELGIVIAARRHHVVGFPEPIPQSHWINEIYPSWFATCQIDPQQPFSGVPIRVGGDWIYVDAESYQSWKNASFGAVARNTHHVQTAPENGAQPGSADPSVADPERAQSKPPEGGQADGAELNDEGSQPTQTESAASAQTLCVESVVGDTNQAPSELVEPLQPAGGEAGDTGQRADCAPKLATKKSRRGAKPSYDWPLIEEEVLRRATWETKPRSVRALTGDILAWCLDKLGKEPGESTVRARISKLLAIHGLTLN